MNTARVSDARSRISYLIVIAAALCVFAVAIAWPTLAMLLRWMTHEAPPPDSGAFGTRQLVLLGRTVWLAAAGTMSAHAVALVVVFWSPRNVAGRFNASSLFAALALLTCPPFAFAFGWDSILPSGMGGYARCIWTWALWCWPIPTVILATGWSRIGLGPFRAALLEARSWRAVYHVALPSLRAYLAFSTLAVFAFLLNEYSVPHAFGLQVYATELLTVMSGSSRLVDALVPAMIPIGVTLAALAASFFAWRRIDKLRGNDITADAHSHSGSEANWALTIALVVAWVVPMIGLLLRMKTPQAFALAVKTYGGDIEATLAVALAGGFLAILMGVGLTGWRMIGNLGVVWALAFGALPGALIGGALIAAFNFESVAALFDHWPIIVLGHVSRFGWLGVLAGVMLRRSLSPALLHQARLDGASDASIFTRIRLPSEWPTLMATALVVAVLSVGDIATTTLIRVPDFSPIALVIIEKFHRFEDSLLGALCLILTGVGVSMAVVVSFLSRVRGKRH